jgi:hypothetical protein
MMAAIITVKQASLSRQTVLDDPRRAAGDAAGSLMHVVDWRSLAGCRVVGPNRSTGPKSR